MDFENDDQYMVVNAYENGKNKSQDFVSFVYFHKRDNQYSQPYYIFATWIDLNHDDMYSYDCDDAAVNFIDLEEVFGLNLGQGEEGSLYCGFWTNERETRSMTFAGQKVDGVEAVHFFDTPYYFWYITLPDTKERLQNIDHSDYTFQEIIDALELHYDKEK